MYSNMDSLKHVRQLCRLFVFGSRIFNQLSRARASSSSSATGASQASHAKPVIAPSNFSAVCFCLPSNLISCTPAQLSSCTQRSCPLCCQTLPVQSESVIALFRLAITTRGGRVVQSTRSATNVELLTALTQVTSPCVCSLPHQTNNRTPGIEL